MKDDTSFTDRRALDVEATIKKLTAKADNLKRIVEIIPSIASAFDRCYWINFYEDGQVICECKTRDDFAPIRALHKGVWVKTIDGKTVRYTACVDGIPITVVVGELPPSCKLVEKRVLVPEHEEVTYETVCGEA